MSMFQGGFMPSDEVCAGIASDDYDDDKWQSYRMDANDPGSYMLLFTMGMCVLVILAIPVSVILGKRYESVRMQEEEATMAFVKDSEPDTAPFAEAVAVPLSTGNSHANANVNVNVNATKKKRHRRKTSFDESSFVKPLEADLEASNFNKNTNVHFRQGTFQHKQRKAGSSELGGSSVAGSSYVHRGSRSRKHGVARSAMSTGGSSVAGSSFVHGNNNSNSGRRGNRSELSGNAGGDRVVYGSAGGHGTNSSAGWRNIMDKVIMPPYQDDEARSVLSRADTRISHMTANSGVSRTPTGMSMQSGYTSTFLDSRPTRRRGRVMTNSSAGAKARRVRKQTLREDIVSPYVEDSNYNLPLRKTNRKEGREWSDTKSDMVGNNANPNKGSGGSYNKYSNHDAMSTNSQLTGKYSTNSSRVGRFRNGRKKRSDNYNHNNDDGTVVSYAPSAMSKIVDDISPNDAADANDPGQTVMNLYQDEQLFEELHIVWGKNAIWRPAIIMRGLDALVDLAQPDNESRRIIKLAIPFTLAVVMDAVFENVSMGFVGNLIGTEALSAYAISHILMGTTAEFIEGLYDSAMTLAPHAIGAGNNYLCGQYLQITVVLYLVASVPSYLFWWMYMKEAVIMFGFSEKEGCLAEEYTKIALFGDFLEMFAEVYHGLLEVTDHEAFSAVIGIIEGLITVMVTFFVLKFPTQVPFFNLEVPSLIHVGYVNVACGFVFFIITLCIVTFKGWVKEYTAGMYKNIALKNTMAVKNVLNTAIPLSLGSLLAYGEWEILTVFAAHLGKGYVTAWAVLGDIWETFEASTEGMGDAAEVRCAYHLGKGNYEMARISANKSLLLGTLLACFITSIFFIIGDNLPGWFTTDPVLQTMIRDAIPLVGLGNVTMTFGMVCWAIIGAQGRYRLATLAAFIGSWTLTMPLSALFVYYFRFDIKGIVSAVVIGYAFAGTVMSYIVLRSDWERLSNIIRELNKMTGELDSSDSDSDAEGGGYESKSSSSGSSEDSEDSDDSDSS